MRWSGSLGRRYLFPKLTGETSAFAKSLKCFNVIGVPFDIQAITDW
jgi:hypothetical protein